jgi:DsbC/DsbD-like thiol-disulfide interchange protein
MGGMVRSWSLAAWLLLAVVNPQETTHLVLKTSASPAIVAPGGKVTLQIDVTPKAKMHVYAPGQDGYIPIQLTITPDPAVTVAKAKYPAGEKYVMPALNETQLVYAKPFRITDELTLVRNVSGTITVKGSVRYQACDDTICYLPKTVPVEWTITVR